MGGEGKYSVPSLKKNISCSHYCNDLNLENLYLLTIRMERKITLSRNHYLLVLGKKNSKIGPLSFLSFLICLLFLHRICHHMSVCLPLWKRALGEANANLILLCVSGTQHGAWHTFRCLMNATNIYTLIVTSLKNGDKESQ